MHPSMRIDRLLILSGLLSLLLAGCAGRPTAPPQPAEPARAALVDAAQRMLGAPYRAGGASPRGFDCSGLVRYSFGRIGVSVPRTAAEQFARARPVGQRALQPGDLVFFNIGGRRVSHVGIYVGERRFVHAPSNGKQVSVDSLDNPYWRRRMVGAGHYFD